MKHKYKTREANTKQNKGFTLIEALVVLFIIGLLTIIAGVGYGVANRHKQVETAARKITSGLDATRDYAIFGQQINGEYPCGYGVALSKNLDKEAREVYTSGKINIDGKNVELTREGALAADLTCDELINQTLNGNKAVSFSYDDTADLSFGNVTIDDIKRKGDATSYKCVVVLFSAPRGIAYYVAAVNVCNPNVGGSGAFNFFSEDVGNPESKDTNYFLTKLKITEGLVSSEGCHKIYPSGNGMNLGECP